MSKMLIHYNGDWHIVTLGLFTDRKDGERTPPFPAYYNAVDSSLVCLWGEENIARELVDPTDAEMRAYEEQQTALRTRGIQAASSVRVIAKVKSTEAAILERILWDEEKYGPMPNRVDIAMMRSLYRVQRGISNIQIKAYLTRTWKSTSDWIANGCDRCPSTRGLYGRDEPCGSCPIWQRLIPDFRKKHKFQYAIGQNPEIPF